MAADWLLNTAPTPHPLSLQMCKPVRPCIVVDLVFTTATRQEHEPTKSEHPSAGRAIAHGRLHLTAGETVLLATQLLLEL